MHARIIQEVTRERINEAENLVVYEPGDEKPGESESRESAGHESSRGVFAHQHCNTVVSIQRREGKQVECAEQKIQHKQDTKCRGRQLCPAARGIRGLSDLRV